MQEEGFIVFAAKPPALSVPQWNEAASKLGLAIEVRDAPDADSARPLVVIYRGEPYTMQVRRALARDIGVPQALAASLQGCDHALSSLDETREWSIVANAFVMAALAEGCGGRLVDAAAQLAVKDVRAWVHRLRDEGASTAYLGGR